MSDTFSSKSYVFVERLRSCRIEALRHGGTYLSSNTVDDFER